MLKYHHEKRKKNIRLAFFLSIFITFLWRFAPNGITALFSLIPVPVVGTLIGVGISIAIDYFIQWVFEDLGVLDMTKIWAADVGTAITNWWNDFWSFNWI